MGCSTAEACTVAMWWHSDFEVLSSAIAVNYGCEIWGIHTPSDSLAEGARKELEKLYLKYLQIQCGVAQSSRLEVVLQWCCTCSPVYFQWHSNDWARPGLVWNTFAASNPFNFGMVCFQPLACITLFCLTMLWMLWHTAVAPRSSFSLYLDWRR